MKKNVSKIRLAVFLLAVAAMVLGASMTVSAGGIAEVTTTAPLRDEPNRGGDPIIKIYAGTTVTTGASLGKYTRVTYTKKNGRAYQGWFFTGYLDIQSGYDLRAIKIECNLRTGPAKSYKRLQTLYEGTLVEVLGTASNGWYRVRVNSNGRTGYITPEGIDGNDRTDVRYTVNDTSNFRNSPYKDTSERNVIGEIPPNSRVIVLDYVITDLRWAYVKYNGRRGYVAVSQLR